MADPTITTGGPAERNRQPPDLAAAELPEQPFRSYQVIKTAPLGWFTLTFLVLPTGGVYPASSPSPSFHTSRLPPNWLPWKWWLPPPIRFYDGGAKFRVGSGEETCVGRVNVAGGAGWKGVRIDIDIPAKDGDPVAGGVTTAVTQHGWSRTYEFLLPSTQQRLLWKGTKRTLRRLQPKEKKHRPFGGPSNGNLKLIDPEHPGRVLAVWENKTDWSVLGNLLVFEEEVGGLGGGDLEAVVMSGLAIVCCERLTGKGMLAGSFK
ncbi:hypothetical protein FGG08_003971 [Glutinoglossum americanum]|uniref:Uncharacterized protein n=1 Tax=Glutinoglossum americanum TaxID=1670608 RepID=A0A9P8I619_9PEZI|nr:hypothetical protein FGG08_003971 [Glutinoglossum americanum]